MTANASSINPKTVPPQELSPDFWEAKGVEAQAWYGGVAGQFKKLARGEAPHSVLERFAAKHRLLIKAAFWRGESRDSVLCRLVDLWLKEAGR
ncbi:MAG: hypothetical protein WBF43_13100 [Methylocella sp.]